jgi:hypothetical protein
MSVVHLPTCPACNWMMRQVRICDGDGTSRCRVFECVRCHTEVMWTPGVQLREEVARGKRVAFRFR